MQRGEPRVRQQQGHLDVADAVTVPERQARDVRFEVSPVQVAKPDVQVPLGVLS